MSISIIDALVFGLVLFGQRAMLTSPRKSNLAWLLSNMLLAWMAIDGGKWVIVLMYCFLGLSNIQLLRKIALQQNVDPAHDAVPIRDRQ